MRLDSFITVAALLGASNGAAIEKRDLTLLEVDKLAAEGLLNLQNHVVINGYFSGSCKLEDVTVRRDWYVLLSPCFLSTLANLRRRHHLSDDEKKAYISAVQCISTKPAITPKEECPGCVSRYDDFVATHINQTMAIHGTVSQQTKPESFRTRPKPTNLIIPPKGSFLSWHRYFTWTYEQALRTECAYTGHQPYWNWPRYALDPLSSPLFDGTSTSMSGNGAPASHDPIAIPSTTTPYITIPPGPGGGCVTSGPFANFTTRLGPMSPAWANLPTNPRTDGLGPNPRCLRRDINAWVSSRWTADANVSSLLTAHADVASFQAALQGDFPNGYLGVHTGGHMTVNGDPGGDLFASPGDPIFFLQHAAIDRTWWTWQNLDVAARTYAVAGATSLLDASSPNATLDDVLDLAYTNGAITIRDAMSTVAGPFCYIYL